MPRVTCLYHKFSPQMIFNVSINVFGNNLILNILRKCVHSLCWQSTYCFLSCFSCFALVGLSLPLKSLFPNNNLGGRGVIFMIYVGIEVVIWSHTVMWVYVPRFLVSSQQRFGVMIQNMHILLWGLTSTEALLSDSIYVNITVPYFSFFFSFSSTNILSSLWIPIHLILHVLLTKVEWVRGGKGVS